MPKKRKNKMTKTEKLREILKKSVGHGIDERKIECDCIWCRKGGTFDQALSAIQQWALEWVGEDKLKEDYHPNDPENEYYEGYNQAKSEIRKAINGYGNESRDREDNL